MSTDVTIHDRRGAEPSQQGVDPWEEMDRLYSKHLKEQDTLHHFYSGVGEYEPAMLSMVEDGELIREFAEDPHMLFLLGQKDKQDKWYPFIDAHGTRFIKVVPMPHADLEHVEAFKMPRFGDNSVNLTHGEQEEVRRLSGGSRLKEEELAMDFRSPSKFLLDEILFTTVDFELPNLPENIQEWLDETAWPTHTRIRNRLIEHLALIMAWKVPGKDNRLKEVKVMRRAAQAKRVNQLWGKFWHWWMKKCEAMKPTGLKPMTNRQLASVKAVFEQFRATLGLDKPVIKFWARIHCMECEVQSNQLLPLSYVPLYEEETDDVAYLEEDSNHDLVTCTACKGEMGKVLWFEEHTILHQDGHTAPDWFDVAQDLKEKIESLYKIAAGMDEIKKLESWLYHIEHLHIKLDADQLLWGEYDHDIDARFC